MRIMLDTNVILSALLFPSQQMNDLFANIVTHHTLVLSSFVIDELYEVIDRKFTGKIEIIDLLMAQITYEEVKTPGEIDVPLVSIRDDTDYPVLHTAILANIDILITGDKDFTEVSIDHPKIMTPKEFLVQFVN